MLKQFPVHMDKQPLELSHFPTRLHAVVWRNWGFVPIQRLAQLLEAEEEQIVALAVAMGLEPNPFVDKLWLERGFITIIRANWHLLPYEQLLELLDWTPEKLAFALKEDDFLWHKLGRLKPNVEPVRYKPMTEEERVRTAKWRQLLERHFPLSKPDRAEKPFGFLEAFAESNQTREQQANTVFSSISSSTAIPPQLDELVLDSSWTIVCHGEGRPRVFAERFADKHAANWGIRLSVIEQTSQVGAAVTRGPFLHLLIEPSQELLSESHRLEMSEAEIRIIAVDEGGILRGLQWLAAEMERRGAPRVQKGVVHRKTRFDLRFIYSYFAVYGDPLLDPALDPYPEKLLERLSELGVNGVWLQSILYQLVPWEAAPHVSAGWEKRIEGLRNLVDKAADYGIGVYLYYNEPRAMPLSFFDDRPDWRGHTDGAHAALCTSHPEVQRFLREGTERLFRDVPGLAGLFTITMSENMTNCYSRAPKGETNCPRCAKRQVQEVVAEVNGLIAEGARSASPDARILPWTWGWTAGYGWTQEQVRDGIRRLPDGVSLMCVSEDELETNIGGVRGMLKDYSMSQIGPSEKSIDSWRTAHERGLSAVAKVQLNNTWESASIPFLPVPDLITEHLERLRDSGVTGLMLSWTLGGYPSFNLELAARHYWEQDCRETTEEELMQRRFGMQAGEWIARAGRQFSAAFREFPFHISVAYTAPQNMGPANLLFADPTGYRATMVGYPYDGLDNWRGIYPEEVLERQFELLTDGWRAGLELLQDLENEPEERKRQEAIRFRQVAEAAYCHFRSAFLQIAFVRSRNVWNGDGNEAERQAAKARMLRLIEEEITLARRLHELVQLDSRIGYEASNHYFYTSRDLQEKVLNCLHVRDKLA